MCQVNDAPSLLVPAVNYLFTVPHSRGEVAWIFTNPGTVVAVETARSLYLLAGYLLFYIGCILMTVDSNMRMAVTCIVCRNVIGINLSGFLSCIFPVDKYSSVNVAYPT